MCSLVADIRRKQSSIGATCKHDRNRKLAKVHYPFRVFNSSFWNHFLSSLVILQVCLIIVYDVRWRNTIQSFSKIGNELLYSWWRQWCSRRFYVLANSMWNDILISFNKRIHPVSTRCIVCESWKGQAAFIKVSFNQVSSVYRCCLAETPKMHKLQSFGP